MYVEQGTRTETVDAVGQVLLDAADYLDTHGWCQGMGSDKGRACALYATWRVTRGTLMYDLAYDRLKTHIGAPVAYWNDARGRTKEEVTRAMREAAHA